MSDKPTPVPTDYVEAPALRTAYRHACAVTRSKIAGNTLIAAFMSAIGGGVLTGAAEGISHLATGNGFWGLPMFGATSAALGVLSYARLTLVDARSGDKDAMEKFQRDALAIVRIAKGHVARESDPFRYTMDQKELDVLVDKAAGLEKDAYYILRMSEPAMLQVRRRMILRLSAVNTAYGRSINDLGSAPKDEIEQIVADAVTSIIREAVEARAIMMGSSGLTPDEISRSITDRMRREVSKAVAIGTPKTDEAMPHGTGHARIDRLMAKAREALAIDPDLTDATGARVDAAFNEHLPRLLKAHAETARHARIEDLGETDRQLEIGVEQIRAMLEEGLQSLRHEKADALRTEVGFLKLRRAASETTLKAIEGGKAA